MKRTFLTLLIIALTALSAAAKNRIIKNPAVEYTPSWICVNEIEFARDATILRCELRNRPHWWVKVEGSTFLKDRDSERTWKFLRVEGVEQDKEIWMPDEGRVACTLYFEPVPADVKEVNLLENNIRPESAVYGISLTKSPTPSLPEWGGGLKDSSSKKKNKSIDPREKYPIYYQNDESILNLSPSSGGAGGGLDTLWHFSAEPYRPMDFYRPGRAHVEVQIDHLPRELREHFQSISVSGEDQILRKKTTLSASLNEENRFVFDLDLAGPMTIGINPLDNYFIQPGDTLEIFTTMEHDPFNEPRYTAFRSNSETAMINALLPKMIERLGVKTGRGVYEAYRKAVEGGKESSEKLAEEWGAIAENILTSEEIRLTLINSPLSTFGKDLIMTYAITEMAEHIEDIRMRYDEDEYIYDESAEIVVLNQENPDFKPLDMDKIYGVQLRHKDLFYDNPLVLCNDWGFVNRTLFGSLFRNYEYVQVTEDYYDQRLVDKFGMRGTFMFDLLQSQDFASDIKSIEQDVSLGKEQASETLDIFNFRLADQLAAISYAPVAKAVLDEYRAVVARLEGGKKEADEDKWTTEQRELWKKITEPYAGNLLFVDFWGMSCGPCRSGMLSMRKKVEALKDDPIRFLYVCDEKYSPRADAEKWMTENNIKGEHIYVTHDEWNQLQQMFNFTGIPHAALADKTGKVIQNGFFISSHTAEQLRDMIGKF